MRSKVAALGGRVGDALAQRREAREQRVALVLLRQTELGVGAVEPVQDPEDPEALVEPVGGHLVINVLKRTSDFIITMKS